MDDDFMQRQNSMRKVSDWDDGQVRGVSAGQRL